jgi:serine phosphatase RsbU (regulator of sigma subunit)
MFTGKITPTSLITGILPKKKTDPPVSQFIPTVVFTFLGATLLFSLLIFFLWQRSGEETRMFQEKSDAQQRELERLRSSTVSLDEKKILEEEKRKIEEKSKKMWQMSETVYKEKKKVDDQVELLKTDKEKLETEKKKVDEKVKKLWSQSMAIHKEKERINELKLEIEHKHKEIIDSVNYAKRIQEAILPEKKEITSHLRDSFILFKPRDIVSGDFYWFSHKNNKSIIAAVDCTGHGVPGAFMSMIGNTLLNQIVNEKGITHPSGILERLNEEVNTSLKQTQQDSDSRDGMDIAICSFEMESGSANVKLEYAGANRPLYLVRQGLLEEIKASKFPIGGLDYDVPKVYTTHTFELEPGNVAYISTDGYADQFNNEDRKLMTKKFKETIVSIQDKTMEEQGNFLGSFIEDWKGGIEQTDDILVIGVKM